MEINKQTIKALSSESRVQILKSLAKRRKMPSELSKELNLAASTIVGHLDVLEKSGLVSKKKTGHKFIYYELTNRGQNLIKPRFPVQFVIMLSLGLVMFIGGTLSFFRQIHFPIVETFMRTGTAGAPAATGVEEAAEDVSTEVINYVTPEFNWVAFIILSVGIIVIIIALVKLLKK